MSPLISILMPVCNVEKYLDDCLKSALCQGFDDIEIICINDGSTDSSLDILRYYAQTDSRIVIIDKKNAGYGAAMNDGLKIARGEYIGVLESDDKVCEGAWASLYELAKGNDLDIVRGIYNKTKFGEVTCFDSNEKVDALCPTSLKRAPLRQTFCPEDYPRCFWINPCIWTCLFKRAFLEENHIWFNETPGASYQDTGFAFKTWACARRAMLVDIPVIFYNLDNESSSSNSKAKVYAVCDEMHEVERFLDERHSPQWLYKVLAAIRYKTYIWNLKRVSDEYKVEFASVMRQEQARDLASRRCELAFFDREKLDSIYADLQLDGIELSILCVLESCNDEQFGVFRQWVLSLSEGVELFVVLPQRLSGQVASLLEECPAKCRAEYYGESRTATAASNAVLDCFRGQVIAVVGENCMPSLQALQELKRLLLSETLDFVKLNSMSARTESDELVYSPVFGPASSANELLDGLTSEKAGLYYGGFIGKWGIKFDEEADCVSRDMLFLLNLYWRFENARYVEVKTGRKLSEGVFAGTFEERIRALRSFLRGRIEKGDFCREDWGEKEWISLMQILVAPEEYRIKSLSDRTTFCVREAYLEYGEDELTAPDVSIIVPVYNVERYLQECLDSLLSQTYDSFEIVCVNDGSTDESGAILSEYAQRDSRIRVLEKSNGGLASARNYGLAHAAGEYVLFVDSDDTIKRSALQTLMKNAKETDAEIVAFGIDSNYFLDDLSAPAWIEKKNPKRKEFFVEFQPEILFGREGAVPFAVRDFFKRSFLRDNNLWFAEGFRFGEDTIFQMEAFPRACNILFIPNKLYNYRVERAGSLMAEAATKQVSKTWCHVQMISHLCKVWTSEGVFDSLKKDFAGWAIDFFYYQFIDCPDADRSSLADYFCCLMRQYYSGGLRTFLDEAHESRIDLIEDSTPSSSRQLTQLPIFELSSSLRDISKKTSVIMILDGSDAGLNSGMRQRTFRSLGQQIEWVSELIVVLLEDAHGFQGGELEYFDESTELINIKADNFYIGLYEALGKCTSDYVLFSKPGIEYRTGIFEYLTNCGVKHSEDVLHFGSVDAYSFGAELPSILAYLNQPFSGRLMADDVLKGWALGGLYHSSLYDKCYRTSLVEMTCREIVHSHCESAFDDSLFGFRLLAAASSYQGLSEMYGCVSFMDSQTVEKGAISHRCVANRGQSALCAMFQGTEEEQWKVVLGAEKEKDAFARGLAAHIPDSVLAGRLMLGQMLCVCGVARSLSALAFCYAPDPSLVLSLLARFVPRCKAAASCKKIGVMVGAAEHNEGNANELVPFWCESAEVVPICDIDRCGAVHISGNTQAQYVPSASVSDAELLGLRIETLDTLVDELGLDTVVLPRDLSKTTFWDIAFFNLKGVRTVLRGPYEFKMLQNLGLSYLKAFPFALGLLDDFDVEQSQESQVATFSTKYPKRCSFARNIDSFEPVSICSEESVSDAQFVSNLIELAGKMVEEEYDKEIQALRRKYERRLRKKSLQVKDLKAELLRERKVRQSISYRIGRAVTAPGRSLRRVVKKLEN